MTVIAWDGVRLAADSMVTIGDVRVGSVEKVTLKRYADKSVLYAATGPAGWLEAWIAWIDAGEKPADRPWTALQPHRTGQIIRVMDGQASSLTPEHPYWTDCDALDAWGAGCDLAIGALEAGTNAIDAAFIATRRSTACGGDVEAWFARHPEGYHGEPNPRCICAECHEHYTTPDNEPELVRHVVGGITGFNVVDYLAPSLSELEAKGQQMATDAACFGQASVACGEGVAGAARDLGDKLTQPSTAMRAFIADRTPVHKPTYLHVVYSDVMGDRAEHVHNMSRVYLDPLDQNGPQYEFTELRTDPHSSESGAVKQLRMLLGDYFETHPGDVHWRVKPEVDLVYDHDERVNRWRGYARLVCIEPTVMVRTEQEWEEKPLPKPVVVTEQDDGGYLALAQQQMRERLTQLNDPATALRRHLDAQAAISAKVHEAIGVKAEMLRRGGVRANPGDKECIHGYVPHTCSTCSRPALVAMAPGANGVVHGEERQGDSRLS